MTFKNRHHRAAALATLIVGIVACCPFEPLLAAETVIVAFGDSTTAPRGELKVYARLLERELSEKRRDVKVINSGVGGNHTGLARRRFQQDVLALSPDIVIIQFGINDAAVDVWRQPPATAARISIEQFSANLQHFVTTLKSQGSRVVLMTPNPMRWTEKLKKLYGHPPYKPADDDGFNVLLSGYAAAVRHVAKENDVPLVDVYRTFQEYDKRPNQSVDDLLLDGMHPNARGHRLVVDLLCKHLLKNNDD